MNLKLTAAVILLSVIALTGYTAFTGTNQEPQATSDSVDSPKAELSDEKETDGKTVSLIWGEMTAKRYPLNNEEQNLLNSLKVTVNKEDYSGFAKVLKTVFEKTLDTHLEFMKVESSLYVKATNKYFDQDDLAKSLEVSTIVYREVPQGWRFKFLRIRTLEKMGRNAFAAGDLAEAERRASEILQMTYRKEGAELMADVYIKKIELALNAKDKNLAKTAIGYISAYEISEEKMAKLARLQEEINKL